MEERYRDCRSSSGYWYPVEVMIGMELIAGVRATLWSSDSMHCCLGSRESRWKSISSSRCPDGPVVPLATRHCVAPDEAILSRID